MITHLEPDILECEVKWALESITMNKASGGDGIPAELFKILKDDANNVLHSICQQIWKTQQWPQDWTTTQRRLKQAEQHQGLDNSSSSSSVAGQQQIIPSSNRCKKALIFSDCRTSYTVNNFVLQGSVLGGPLPNGWGPRFGAPPGVVGSD